MKFFVTCLLSGLVSCLICLGSLCVAAASVVCYYMSAMSVEFLYGLLWFIGGFALLTVFIWSILIIGMFVSQSITILYNMTSSGT